MREEKTMVSDAHALDWREVLGRNRAVVSWLYHIVEHGWFISAVESIHGSYGIPTTLNGQHAWWSSENRSLIEGIFMEITTRAQYCSWSSLEVVSVCIICDHAQVAQCRVYSWRSGIILTLRVLSWWLAHANVGVIACSRIIPSFLWPLGGSGRNSCQEAMEDLEMWDCTAVSSVVGS